MSTPSGKDFVKLLQESNYDVSSVPNEIIDGMFECNETSEFMQWLCRYIGSDNVLKEEEVEEYDTWVANNIHDNDNMSEGCYDDGSRGDTYLENLSDENTASNELITCLSKVQDNLRAQLDPVEEKLNAVQQQEVLARQELASAQDECDELCKELDDVRSRAVDSIERSARCFTAGQDDEALLLNLGQVSLTDFKKEMINCTRLIASIMRRQVLEKMAYLEEDGEHLFMQQLTYNQDDNTEIVFGQNESAFKKYLQKINFLQESLCEIKLSLAVSATEEKQHLAAIDLLRELTNTINAGQFHLSQTQLKYQLLNFTQVVSSFEEPNEELVTELVKVVQHICESSVLMMFVNESRAVEVVQRYSLARYNTLASHLGYQIRHSDLLWLLFTYEKNRVESITQLSEMYYETTMEVFSELAERREIMKSIQEKHSLEKRQLCVGTNLFALVKPWFACHDDAPASQLFQALCQLDQDIASRKQQIVDLLKESKRIIIENIKSTKALEACVLSEPTQKPVLVPTDLIFDLRHIQQREDQVTTSFNAIFNHFTAAKKAFKNPLMFEKRLLWVYFLMDGEKLEKLLQKMRKPVKKE